MKNKIYLAGPIFALLFVLALAILALVVVQYANSSRELPILGTVSSFELEEMRGDTFTHNSFNGKISVVDFFFTSCDGPCPLMSQAMSELYQFYETTQKVQFVSISVDPETDTPQVMLKYSEKYGVKDERWKFIRGEAEKIQWLSENVFFLAGELPALHSTKFILVDNIGQIRGYYDLFQPDNVKLLKEHIRELGKKL